VAQRGLSISDWTAEEKVVTWLSVVRPFGDEGFTFNENEGVWVGLIVAVGDEMDGSRASGRGLAGR
jgi:hypothetical protein